MNILDFHDINFQKEIYEVWRICWLLELLEFVLKNGNQDGFPVKVYKSQVFENDQKQLALNDQQFYYPKLGFIDLQFCYRLEQGLALKMLACVMLYLFGFNDRRLFTDDKFKDYPANLPNFNYKKASDVHLTNVYRLLISGKTEFSGKSVKVRLEESLLILSGERDISFLKAKVYKSKLAKRDCLNLISQVEKSDLKKSGLGYGYLSDKQVEDIRFWQKYFFTEEMRLKLFGKIEFKSSFPKLTKKLFPEKIGVRIKAGDIFVDPTEHNEEVCLVLALGYSNEIEAFDFIESSVLDNSISEVLILAIIDLAVLQGEVSYFAFSIDNELDLTTCFVDKDLWLNLQGKLFYQPKIDDLAQASWLYNNVLDWAKLQKEEARDYLVKRFEELDILTVFEIFKKIIEADEFKLRCYFKLKTFVENLTLKDELLLRKMESDLQKVVQKSGDLFLELSHSIKEQMTRLKLTY